MSATVRIRTDVADNPLESQKYEAATYDFSRGRKSTPKHHDPTEERRSPKVSAGTSTPRGRPDSGRSGQAEPLLPGNGTVGLFELP